MNRYAKFAWGVLAYNLLVILWGAFVRATGSGAGCGSHWPLCNGEVIPRSPQVETLIEFTHRSSSAISFLLVLGLAVFAWRLYPKGSLVRLGAAISLFFILTEALIGAGLVLFAWVAMDASLSRAIAMSIHLINTFLLLAALSLTAWWAAGNPGVGGTGHTWMAPALAIGFLFVLAVGVSGALTALGDTLFPASSLQAGLQSDFSPYAHFLIRLRLVHPFIAVSMGIYLTVLASAIRSARRDGRIKAFGSGLIGLLVVQLAAGMLNVILLAPVWLQLVHLLLADLAWVTLVLFAALSLTLQPITDQTRVTAALASPGASGS